MEIEIYKVTYVVRVLYTKKENLSIYCGVGPYVIDAA